jgi:oligopeptide/dipeptide ABC transporter ATP-binding protein
MSDAPILEVERLRVSYRAGDRIVHAIEDASLAIGAGEAIGLVGESGSGKSTLARAALGLLPERVACIEAGRVAIAGRDVTHASPRDWESIRGRPVAIVFQDPLSYLNPVMRIGSQIAESVTRHDLGARVDHRVAELLELVALPAACAQARPHELSGGMRQRVLLAIALGCRPRLLIADEPTTALDVTTQAEILALLASLRQRLDMALLLISHDLAVVASACDRVAVMYAGHTVEWGDTASVFARPAHPYAAALIASARAARDPTGHFASIEGDMPDRSATIVGCPFAPRCPLATAQCIAVMPEPTAVPNGRHVRCWHADAQQARGGPA